jgi:hypothetical protein
MKQIYVVTLSSDGEKAGQLVGSVGRSWLEHIMHQCTNEKG